MPTELTGQSYLTTFCRWVLSKAAQSDYITPADLTNAYLFAVTLPDFKALNVIDDANRANGYEEPTDIQKSGNAFNVNLSHPDPDPDLLAIMLAFALGGDISKDNPTSGVYDYTIEPADNTDRELPLMTVGARLGKTIEKARYLATVVNQLQISQGSEPGAFLSMNASLTGSGNRDADPTSEVVTAAGNATSLTVSSAIYGADSDARVESIHKILCDLDDDGVYEKEVTYTASPTTTTITITAPGTDTDSHNYLVIYRTDSVESGWGATLDITPKNPRYPFKLSDLSELKINGTWDGSSYSDGLSINCPFQNFQYTLNNNVQLKFCPGGAGDYADKILRGARTQMIALGKELTNWLYQEFGENLRLTSLYAKWTGEEIASGYNYTLELIFPKIKYANPALNTYGEFLGESLNLVPLDGGTYPTVIAKVRCALDGIRGA